MMANWYYSVGGRAEGPVNELFILETLKAGRFTLVDLVFQEGASAWCTIGEVAKFREAFESFAPPVATELKEMQSSCVWIVLKKNHQAFEQTGPFTIEQILARLGSGETTYSEFAWRPGFQRWMRIGDLAEFDRRRLAHADDFSVRAVPLPVVAVAEPEMIEIDDFKQSVGRLERNQPLATSTFNQAPIETNGVDLTIDPNDEDEPKRFDEITQPSFSIVPLAMDDENTSDLSGVIPAQPLLQKLQGPVDMAPPPRLVPAEDAPDSSSHEMSEDTNPGFQSEDLVSTKIIESKLGDLLKRPHDNQPGRDEPSGSPVAVNPPPLPRFEAELEVEKTQIMSRRSSEPLSQTLAAMAEETVVHVRAKDGAAAKIPPARPEPVVEEIESAETVIERSRHKKSQRNSFSGNKDKEISEPRAEASGSFFKSKVIRLFAAGLAAGVLIVAGLHYLAARSSSGLSDASDSDEAKDTSSIQSSHKSQSREVAPPPPPHPPSVSQDLSLPPPAPSSPALKGQLPSSSGKEGESEKPVAAKSAAPKPLLAKAAAPSAPYAVLASAVSGVKATPPGKGPATAAEILPYELSSTQPLLLVQTNAALGEKILFHLKARSGDALKQPSVDRTLSVTRTVGEIPGIDLTKAGVASGSYKVEVAVGDLHKSTTIFIGSRDAKFAQDLEHHLKSIAFQQQREKKLMFYAAKKFEGLAESLNDSFSKSHAQPKTWHVFLAKWRREVSVAHRPMVSFLNSTAKDQLAYPDELKDLNQMVKQLNAQAQELDMAVMQKRELASQSPAAIAREFTRIKQEVAMISSRH